MDDFQEMRMQALIALVVSFPRLVCGLLVRGFFEGDYSLGQRAGMVSAIGMGARELAGMEDNDLPLSEASGKGKIAADMFPSKKLLGKMHDTWSGAGRKAGPLDRITGSMEKLMISPMAADAADKVTGPNVLKVRTFSSRIEVEKRRKKPVESKLGKVVGEAFFFPLTGRWWGALKDLWVTLVLNVRGGGLLIILSVVEAKVFILNHSCLRSLSRLWLSFFIPLGPPLLRFRK